MPEVGAALKAARLADGSLLVHHEGLPDFLLGLAKGGTATLRKEEQVASTPKERLAQIDEVLRTDSQRYFREKLDEEALALRRQTIGERSADEAAGRAPVSGREKQILDVMRRDMSEYFKRGLDRELAAIRAAKASKGI